MFPFLYASTTQRHRVNYSTWTKMELMNQNILYPMLNSIDMFSTQNTCELEFGIELYCYTYKIA